jgi:hypothetical protein
MLLHSRQATIQICEPLFLPFCGQLKIGFRRLIIKKTTVRTYLDLPHFTVKNVSDLTTKKRDYEF